MKKKTGIKELILVPSQRWIYVSSEGKQGVQPSNNKVFLKKWPLSVFADSNVRLFYLTL